MINHRDLTQFCGIHIRGEPMYLTYKYYLPAIVRMVTEPSF